MTFSFNTTDAIPDDARRLGELYHENSKLRPRASARLGRWIGDVLESPYAVTMMSRAYKRYPHAPRVPLAEPAATPRVPISDVIAARRSVMSGQPGPKFAPQPLGAAQLARLLVDTYGITGQLTNELHGVAVEQDLRAVPSGGALYPLEIYPVVVRGGEVPAGLYHYDVKGAALERLRDGADPAALARMTSYQEVLAEAAVVFVITASFGRSYFKYHERGYRFVLLEAGHAAEHLYLVATALGLGVVAIGGFFDDEVNEYVGVDGVDEAAVYLVACGLPATAAGQPSDVM